MTPPQLALWDEDGQPFDNRPLPLRVADKWGFPLTYIDRDSDPENYIYHAQEWIMGLTSCTKKQASDTWSRLRIEIETFKAPVQTKGGEFQFDFVTHEGLYAIAQSLRATKKRGELLETILKYLQKSGVYKDWSQRNPEKAAEQLTARAKGIQKRNEFTDAARDTHALHHPDYAALTNAEYKTLFGAFKAELVKQLGLTPSQASRFRDQLHVHALNTLQSVEDASAARMRQLNRTLTDTEQNAIVVDYAREALPFLRRVCADLGIHLAVDRPLLSR